MHDVRLPVVQGRERELALKDVEEFLGLVPVQGRAAPRGDRGLPRHKGPTRLRGAHFDRHQLGPQQQVALPLASGQHRDGLVA